MGIITMFMIAVGLAMDSLAVSISGGIFMKPFWLKQAMKLALTMGIFQGGMTLTMRGGLWESVSVHTSQHTIIGLLSFYYLSWEAK